jgi:hypothetical protein
MRTPLATVLLALAAFTGMAAARAPEFTQAPFAARDGGAVSVAFTFRHGARHVEVTLGGHRARAERVPDTRSSYVAVVPGSGAMRAGRSYPATLSWRRGAGRRSMAEQLYVHRRFPGGRG